MSEATKREPRAGDVWVDGGIEEQDARERVHLLLTVFHRTCWRQSPGELIARTAARVAAGRISRRAGLFAVRSMAVAS